MKHLSTTVIAVAVLIADCRAAPGVAPLASTLFADEKSEKDSLDVNEVGPDENWQLFNRLTKTRAYDYPTDPEKTRVLLKEIEEFSRLVPTPTAAVTDGDADGTTTGRPDGDVTENDPASSDWIGSAWKNLAQNEDAAASGRFGSSQREDDDSNVEDIIKKISTDLKKLYTKIKEVIVVVKNWVKSTRGSAMKEYDGPSTMSASASESDGVFVIAEPLVGDVDKSNKYTVPIFSD